MHYHEKKIKITEAYLDENKHVNNVQYVHWVEMMAAEHWKLLKDQTMYSDGVWFLSEHHIQYKKQVYLGDELVMRTYPLKPEGVRQPRKVMFYKNDELVVESLTHWILIHHETGKIIRIKPDWLDFLLGD